MPFGNLGGWTGLILIVIVLLLFAAPKLPSLAKNLGQSMRIFKQEMKSMKTDDASTTPQVAPPAAAPSADHPAPAAPTAPATPAAERVRSDEPDAGTAPKN